MEPSNRAHPDVSILDVQFAIEDLPRLLGMSRVLIDHAVADGTLRTVSGKAGVVAVRRADVALWLKRRPYASHFSEETGEATSR